MSTSILVAPAKGKPSRPGLRSSKQAGRKRDSRLDPILIAATVEVLAEVGYDRMTIAMVADRASVGRASVYRRWPSKAELVVEAIRASSSSYVDLEHLPDTGTLRGDLLALFEPRTIAEGERIIKAMAAIAYVLAESKLDPDTTSGLAVDPWAAAHKRLIERSAMRGECPRPDDLDAMSQVVPAAVTYQAIVKRQAVDLLFLTSVIDDVLLPALRGSASRLP